jgi:predicted RNA polymerase sigma factor
VNDKLPNYWPMPPFLNISEEERAAFLLRRFQGLKDHEIAEVQGATRETVNRRISRFLAKVRELRAACPDNRELIDRLISSEPPSKQTDK